MGLSSSVFSKGSFHEPLGDQTTPISTLRLHLGLLNCAMLDKVKTLKLSPITKYVGLSFVVYLLALLVVAYIPSWGSMWHGVLYLSAPEALLFFGVSFFLLYLLKQRWPTLEAEKIYFRLSLAITSTVVIGSLISLVSRDFANYLLAVYAVSMIAWALFERLLNVALACALFVSLLIFLPIDVKIKHGSGESNENGVSVQVLDASYGLVDKFEPGTYPMGCEIPAYPIKWILRVQLW